MPELNIGLYEWPSSTELKNLEGMAFFSFFYFPQKKVKKRKGKKKKFTLVESLWTIDYFKSQYIPVS